MYHAGQALAAQADYCLHRDTAISYGQVRGALSVIAFAVGIAKVRPICHLIYAHGQGGAVLADSACTQTRVAAFRSAKHKAAAMQKKRTTALLA